MRRDFILLLAMLSATFWMNSCGVGDVIEEPVELQFRAEIQGTEGFESITGDGSVISLENEFTAAVEISGAEPGDMHPWHLLEGNCGEDGEVMGPADAYPPVAVDSTGSGSASITITNTGLQEGRNYQISLYRSEEEPETIIACGNLEENEFFEDE